MDSIQLGKKLYLARKKRGITQETLAQAIDVTPKYISALECGRKVPHLNTFIALANYLKVDANTLLSDSLDTFPSSEGGEIEKAMAGLPLAEQKRLLRILAFLIEDAKNN